MAKTSTKKTYTFTVGRRKSASARVRLFKGAGESTINGKPVSKTDKVLQRPFTLTDTQDKFYFTAVVAGGGVMGQKDAVVHGVARALAKVNPEKYRGMLKKNNLLTRDPRERQRRMVGTGGKARRQKQSPKR